MKTKIIIAMALLALACVGLYFYTYKGHRDIAAESIDYATTVKSLQEQFAQNATKANKQYADKTIEVSGKITSFDLQEHSVVIDEKLSAVFEKSVLNNLELQKRVKIKGRFVGYDDLLEEFKMDQVVLSE